MKSGEWELFFYLSNFTFVNISFAQRGAEWVYASAPFLQPHGPSFPSNHQGPAQPLRHVHSRPERGRSTGSRKSPGGSFPEPSGAGRVSVPLKGEALGKQHEAPEVLSGGPVTHPPARNLPVLRPPATPPGGGGLAGA